MLQRVDAGVRNIRIRLQIPVAIEQKRCLNDLPRSFETPPLRRVRRQITGALLDRGNDTQAFGSAKEGDGALTLGRE